MSNKNIANFGFAALAVAGLLASGCNKHPKVSTNAPPKPTVSSPSSSDTGSRQTASNDRGTSSSTPSNSSSGITQNERDTLNRSLSNLEDALFDYDKATIRPDATKALESDTTVIRNILAKYPEQKVLIEGHADERGSDEYNIALGDKRALAAKDFLIGLGIQQSQLDIVSFGKQRPVCTDHTEDCWQKNRRAHLVAENK